MKIKILICVILMFFVSFTIFTTFNYYFPSHLTASEIEFFNQDFEGSEKIILIGSSHVGQLNATYIEETVVNTNQKYKVYNLAYENDFPERRIKSLDKMLLLEPTLVLYGISYRDFPSMANPPLLLDPKQFFNDLHIAEQGDFGIKNPKRTTLEFIRNILQQTGLVDSSNQLNLQNTPFYPYDITTHFKISDYDELESQRVTSESKGINLERPVPPGDKQTVTLIKMINELKKNKINVVLFTTPLHKIYLEELPELEKETFDKILNRIEKETDVEIYNLMFDYSDLPIWTNISHISYNTNATIFSEDVAKIILDEIEQ